MTSEPRDVVLTVLRRIGGGVTVPELAHKTKLTGPAVVEALRDLEDRGLARPWSWTAVQEGDA